jgi:RNA-dependent RNA polymerase
MKEMPDITRNGYIFTDGSGEISPDFASQISKSLGLESTPSAFQVTPGYVTSKSYKIRLGSLKGVVVVNPKLSHALIYRPSMKKYEIPFPTRSQRVLEVIQYSKISSGHLNRQFIILLHVLGVPTEYFVTLQDEALKHLDKIGRDR